ncbi:MAG: EutN/CcmL family microcompartment protein [Candidatus Latescibacteria bacterium]|nr:EutN/CcmL family microcompartment protein [Candidatus Latescibacterota bacterium]
MRLGHIIGKVWATAKTPTLTGVTLFVMQPLNHHRKPAGTPIIVVDSVGAGEGETVFWVGGAEATLAIQGRVIPSDASIVGIVDKVNTNNSGL